VSKFEEYTLNKKNKNKSQVYDYDIAQLTVTVRDAKISLTSVNTARTHILTYMA